MRRTRNASIVNNMDDRWLLFNQVMTAPMIASLYHYHPQTIRDWCNEGKIMAERQGKNWLIVRSSVDEYLRKQRDIHSKKVYPAPKRT